MTAFLKPVRESEDMSRSKLLERMRLEEWENWRAIEVPYIDWGNGVEISVRPPFGGAVARMLVRNKDDNTRMVSIYLDWFDRLGFMREPYWEAYALGKDDNEPERFLLNETQQLVDCVRREIGLEKK